MDFEKMMADLFADEDRARGMARHLMELAQRDPGAAAREKDSLLAFLRGPMERHMVYEETIMFPKLVEHGLEPEVDVAKKHHEGLRAEAKNLEAATNPEAIARTVFLAARLMLHHTNFEGDFIYPELSKEQWKSLMLATGE
jgi:iron-sulfur cluster repair protein YtfE (RIC family)